MPERPYYLDWPESERQQIAEDYKSGMSMKTLALRYHHGREAIRTYLAALGISRPQNAAGMHVPRVVGRTRTPRIYELAAWLVRAKEILGRGPDEQQITRILEQIRSSGGGRIKPQESHSGKGVAA